MGDLPRIRRETNAMAGRLSRVNITRLRESFVEVWSPVVEISDNQRCPDRLVLEGVSLPYYLTSRQSGKRIEDVKRQEPYGCRERKGVLVCFQQSSTNMANVFDARKRRVARVAAIHLVIRKVECMAGLEKIYESPDPPSPPILFDGDRSPSTKQT